MFSDQLTALIRIDNLNIIRLALQSTWNCIPDHNNSSDHLIPPNKEDKQHMNHQALLFNCRYILVAHKLSNPVAMVFNTLDTTNMKHLFL